MKGLIIASAILLFPLSVLSQSNEKEKLFIELNRKRIINLTYNIQEQQELDRKAKHLSVMFAHDGKGKGQRYSGECIYRGRFIWAIESFMESPGHRKILRDRKARAACIGTYQDDTYQYVVIRTYE